MKLVGPKKIVLIYSCLNLYFNINKARFKPANGRFELLSSRSEIILDLEVNKSCYRDTLGQ